MNLRLGVVTAFILIIGMACSSTKKTDPLLHEREPASDSVLKFEKIPPTEEQDITEALSVINEAYRSQYSSRSQNHALRAQHAKAHGCVRASFDVNQSIPAGMQLGVFSMPGRSFQAWIRFSNGDPHVQHDSAPGSRGFAIKLMSVGGPKLLEQDETETQDFLMHNFPTFLAQDVRSVVKFLRVQANAGRDLSRSLRDFWQAMNRPDENLLREFGRVAEIGLHQAPDVLTQRYWSGLPASMGDLPVKFSVAPCPGNGVGYSNLELLERDHLRKFLKRRLARGDACFLFMVQRYVDENTTPIEDGTKIWPERNANPSSPFLPLATIRIPRQDFDTSGQNEFCENLSFTPWHSLPEHRPLGGLNRLRKAVYRESSQIRHHLSGSPNSEPHS